MPDQYTQVTNKSYMTRIIDSIKGIVFGLVLFIASFAVLYMNEGRVDVSDIAVNAIPASTQANGEFVYVTDEIKSEEKLGDGMFLKNGDYLAVKRNVEVYAWIESSESSSETNLGGSETTETKYTYATNWVNEAASSANFKVVEGHSNISKSIPDLDANVNSATISGYGLNIKKLQLPVFTDLSINAENTTLNNKGVLEGNYVFVGTGTFAQPKVGDMRIKYSMIPHGFNGTVFGKLNAQNVEPFVTDGTIVYRLFDGSRDEALAAMHTEYTTRGWIIRLVGFLMMWIGLSSLFKPISVVLDVVPMFGALSRAGAGLITFLVSLVLSIVTILVAMILHNVWAIVVSALVVMAIFGYMLKIKGNKPNVVKV